MVQVNPDNGITESPGTSRWLSTPSELDQWLLGLPLEAPVALDTEFERVSTFYPIPGLVQLGGAGQLWLVDPEVAAGSDQFRAMLNDPTRPKLLYAMSEDLELFRHWLDLEPRGVIDLQVGAALAGAGFSVGYARLVETLFGEVLDKSATRSDWVSRPLSAQQEKYAIDDIRFLEPVYQWVAPRLQERGLSAAMAEESERFAEEAAAAENPETHYLKLRGGWGLNPDQQVLLQALVAWRERECRRVDRPRSRVINDGLLIAIAERQPESLEALSDVQGVAPGFVRRYGESLLQLTTAAPELDGGDFEFIPRPLTRDQQALYKKVKKHFRNAAESIDIPIEILAPRKRIEAVIQSRNLTGSPFFEGWRRQVIAPVASDIEELLRQ
ncbi:ribonuclease D [Marinobacter fuscus]|uniref:Ribonuclease D n=1 Tax=Marinobacter fuscus TaxID=2109942 RepID=A0A2T1K415_9GAMM|nr:HRDC domain-containing protein [Marinobacter fuscus]PSF04837.1 ribonuclease D [Marinobacter fuscus]